jgi:DNA-binding HxlR family transcriptional regulator
MGAATAKSKRPRATPEPIADASDDQLVVAMALDPSGDEVASDDDSDPSGQSAIGRTLDLIGDRWCFLILRDSFRGIRRFDDFRSELGIARPVLADRLRRLVDAGVFSKVRYCDKPARYEYRLTTRGLELSPVLVALMQWGDRHLSDDTGPRRVLVHDACGHPIDQVTVCWHCDTTVTPTDITSRPGNASSNRKAPSRLAQ